MVILQMIDLTKTSSLILKTPLAKYIYNDVIKSYTLITNDTYNKLKEEIIEDNEEIQKLYKSGYFANRIHNDIDTKSSYHSIEQQSRLIKKMVLQVTKSCNLRCFYCPYSQDGSYDRKHSLERMDKEVALNAVTFYLNIRGIQNIK